MAELVAVVHPAGQGAEQALGALRRMQSDGQLELLEDFGRDLCAALGAGGAVTVLLARDVRQVRAALGEGAHLVRAALGDEWLWQRAVGDSRNPQVAGQRRRESGGESSTDSGQ